mmetsp:Transcript_24495/g.58241  ORF Transcript_24495/g.58241 Transcript_24495/m.58241 type:complete len:295 (+) Transcript_24495:291-1175(+)
MEDACAAARNGQLAFFQETDKSKLQQLLEKYDSDGRTLLHNTVTSKNVGLVNYILGFSPEVNTEDDELVSASDGQRSSLCSLVLNVAFRLSAAGILFAPKHAGSPQRRAVQFLLLESRGYDNCSLVCQGWSPLHTAASIGSEAIVSLLLGCGARVDPRNSSGCTPLHYAVSKGHVAVAERLLDAGASPTVADRYGGTCLHKAAVKGHSPLAALLLRRGARVDDADKAGQTALHLAVSMGAKHTAVLLLARGADPEAEDKEGETPLSLAGGMRAMLEGTAKAVRDGTFDEDELEM